MDSEAKTSVQYITVDENHDGQRVDNFLLTFLKGVPKSYIYRILRKGEVRVNKSRIKPDYRLLSGDIVRIPPVRRDVSHKAISPPRDLVDQLEASVLYEDEGLLILNKPAGLAVHGGSGLPYGVIEVLRSARRNAKYLELVHRLDRDTSGCLMIAKSRTILNHLHQALRHGEVKKTYMAVVKGKWRGTGQDVEENLEKHIIESGERMVKIASVGGQSAHTYFDPVKVYKNASLMKISLFTGRTHQIRVHSAHLCHPIAGDTKYGDKAFNQSLKEKGLKRLFLHAYSLECQLPDMVKPLVIKAELPEEFEKFD